MEPEIINMESVLATFAKGEMVIVFDQPREKEGDFFVLAEHITAEKIHILQTYARGMICTAVGQEVFDRLNLQLMVEHNENPYGTNFCISLDAREGVTTGVSAADRAYTNRLLASPYAKRSDFVCPGHTVPLLAQDPQERFGHTEAALALAQMAGAQPVVVIGEILNATGAIANYQELWALAQVFQVPLVTLESVKNCFLSQKMSLYK